MTRLADLMEEEQELFATIDAWDNGMRQGAPWFPSMWLREASLFHPYGES